MPTLLTTYQQTEEHIIEGIKELIDEHEYDTDILTSNDTLEEIVQHFIEEFEPYMNVDYISGVEDINFNAREMIKLMKTFNEMRLEYGNETFMDWDRLETEGTEYFINNVIWTAYWNNQETIVDYLTEKISLLRREAAVGEVEGIDDYIVDSITRAYHRGGWMAIMERIQFWMNGEHENTEARLAFINQQVKIACDRLGVNFSFERVSKKEWEEKQKEKEFIENFKKTTMGVIEVMLEKIDEKKRDMKEYDYMELMKHLKMAWELVEVVQSKERVLIVKEIVNDFWKGISQKL